MALVCLEDRGNKYTHVISISRERARLILQKKYIFCPQIKHLHGCVKIRETGVDDERGCHTWTQSQKPVFSGNRPGIETSSLLFHHVSCFISHLFLAFSWEEGHPGFCFLHWHETLVSQLFSRLTGRAQTPFKIYTNIQWKLNEWHSTEIKSFLEYGMLSIST